MTYMNGAQERHLADIKDQFATQVDAKYRRGAAEHGGELLDYTPLVLVGFALDEAIDQVVYLLSIRDKLMKEQGASPPLPTQVTP